MTTPKPALPEPVAWLHDVVATDGEPDHALSFAPDNFPLQGVGGFRSIGCQPLYSCLAATTSPAEQPKPAVLTAEDALSLIGVAHWPGMKKGLAASLLPVARKIAEAAGDRGLARRCDELLAALSGEQP